jgi:hypothetical protein
MALATAGLVGLVVSQQPLVVLDGYAAGDRFGNAVNRAGDVDGDGYDDFIVGAPFGSPRGPRSGYARVYSGRTWNVLWSFDGQAPNDELGYAVAPAGDVDADGRGDFVIGVLGPRPGYGSFAGHAIVCSGATGAPLWIFPGAVAYDYFGLSVAGAGDVDGDGFDDIVAGAPGYDHAGSASGRITAFSGRTGQVLHVKDGEGGGDNFGWSVAGLGDVDGDGYADFMAGAPRHATGYAKVYSGRTGTLLWRVAGLGTGDYFGWSVGAAGDVDGDLHADFIVGAHLADPNGTDSGAATVWSGRTGAILWHWNGQNAGDQFGWAVAGAGDLDGDGRAELLVGARMVDANGADSGRAYVFDGRIGLPMVTIDGRAANDWFGFSVCAAGDLNRDGFADFGVGAMQDHRTGSDAGAAYVYSLPSASVLPHVRYRNAGCRGSDGRAPHIEVRGRAALGQSYEVRLRGALPSSTAFLNVGVPWNLPLGNLAPGCVLLAWPLASFGAPTDAAGMATIVPGFLPIPSLPALLGAQLDHQWLVLDAANNSLGIAASNGADVVIGQ